MVSVYLRKSIKAGPFRVNLSKSGIGVSTGIPGLRVGKGPSGAYVRMAKGGVYYRKTISSNGSNSPTRAPHPAVPAAPGPLPAVSEDVFMEDVTGATTLELAEASASELVSQLNEAARHRSLGLLVALLYLLVVTIPLGIWVRARDKARRTVVVFYDVNDDFATRFSHVADALAAVQHCAACWYVTSEGALQTTQQVKAHAGASTLVKRLPGRVGIDGPPALATNITVPSLTSGTRAVHFLPDRILVGDGRRYAEVAYADCKAEAGTTRFVEDGSVPKDATKVGTTWKYVNKSGGPDKRYKDNKQLPIMQYGELTLSSPSGFHFVWQTSKAEVPRPLVDALTVMKNA